MDLVMATKFYQTVIDHAFIIMRLYFAKTITKIYCFYTTLNYYIRNRKMEKEEIT